MKILHTADLHLGQTIYQNYDREEEHRHFFDQLKKWCMEEKPDALVVSGDIFDIAQPSAAAKRFFNDFFVALHGEVPQMRIVITAGNHDSASRLQADSSVWCAAGVTLVGMGPSSDQGDDATDWQEQYIVRMESGYIVAMPYVYGSHRAQIQMLLDRVAAENSNNLPVVMLAHQTVAGGNYAGHKVNKRRAADDGENADVTDVFEIGTLKSLPLDEFGSGYDYLALGHIHMPQTIGHDDFDKDDVTYTAPVARYSGSVLHVSADEQYPHSVSLVEMDRHGGSVRIRTLRIEELRHFYTLPLGGGCYLSGEEALAGIAELADDAAKKGYFRLRFDKKADVPININELVFEAISGYDDRLRFNQQHIWVGNEEQRADDEAEQPTFEVAEVAEMKDPMDFVEKAKVEHHGITDEELRKAFAEVAETIRRQDDGTAKKKGRKTDNNQ